MIKNSDMIDDEDKQYRLMMEIRQRYELEEFALKMDRNDILKDVIYKGENMSGFFEEVEFVKLHADAQEPTRAHDADAGSDLRCLEDFQLFPGQTKMVRTGVAIGVPNHAYGQVASRSSLAKKGVFVTGGVIDHGYTGECGVVLNNLGDDKISFRKGDKIAQIIFHPIIEVTFKEVNNLPNSARGDGGFGSSGR